VTVLIDDVRSIKDASTQLLVIQIKIT